MMLFMERAPIWLLALVTFALFFAAVQIGRWIGRRQASGRDEGADGGAEKGDSGLLVSSTLGLMALLLGFTVSMAVSRYDERRGVMVAEGNAMGTFIYRTDLMPAEQRDKVRDALETYVAARVEVGRTNVSPDELAAARLRQAAAQQAIWDAVVEAAALVTDGSYRMLIVNSANEMFDSAAARDIALENRIPHTLVLLLFLFPLASLLLIGYVSHKSARAQALASFEMILLLTLVLAVIADLNRPRRGTILAPQEVVLAAQEQLRQAVARGTAPVAAPTIDKTGE